ncbi:MAG: ABC transporter ATP-binding protein [Candidatus Bathyarchaeia archaeon]
MRVTVMLEIKNLFVSIGDKEILKGINLAVPTGEVHALFGPNGSGKTTLLRTIMGFPACKVTSGSITYNGEDLARVPLNVRAEKGIGFSFQRPPTIRGVKTRKILEKCSRGRFDVECLADELKMRDFLDRDINAGFSGGEIKRVELLQLLAQDPTFILLDEPESGVDIQAIGLIGNMINRLLRRDSKCAHQSTPPTSKSAIIITHTGDILDYVPADRGHVLCGGKIICSGNPSTILNKIRSAGYEECLRCPS